MSSNNCIIYHLRPLTTISIIADITDEGPQTENFDDFQLNSYCVFSSSKKSFYFIIKDTIMNNIRSMKLHTHTHTHTHIPRIVNLPASTRGDIVGNCNGADLVIQTSVKK